MLGPETLLGVSTVLVPADGRAGLLAKLRLLSGAVFVQRQTSTTGSPQMAYVISAHCPAGLGLLPPTAGPSCDLTQLQCDSLGVERDRTSLSTAPEIVAFPWQQLSAGCAALPTPYPDLAACWATWGACGAPPESKLVQRIYLQSFDS